MFSQNLRLVGTAPGDPEHAHPAGASIARTLSSTIAAAGWRVSEFDNWRDCGWSLDCRRGAAELQVVLSEIAPSEWLFQVAPLHAPGFIGRLRGRGPSAGRDDALDLARVVHAALAAESYLSRPRWAWDRLPEDADATPEPAPWTGG